MRETNNPINTHIGKKLREFRKETNLTQADVGRYLNISWQQVQKYEAAKNRISASKLWLIAKLMNKDINDFFPLED